MDERRPGSRGSWTVTRRALRSEACSINRDLLRTRVFAYRRRCTRRIVRRVARVRARARVARACDGPSSPDGAPNGSPVLASVPHQHRGTPPGRPCRPEARAGDLGAGGQR